jgi:hypothetical protein
MSYNFSMRFEAHVPGKVHIPGLSETTTQESLTQYAQQWYVAGKLTGSRSGPENCRPRRPLTMPSMVWSIGAQSRSVQYRRGRVAFALRTQRVRKRSSRQRQS